MDYNSTIMEIVHLKRPELDLEDVYIALAINEVEQRIKNYCVDQKYLRHSILHGLT